MECTSIMNLISFAWNRVAPCLYKTCERQCLEAGDPLKRSRLPVFDCSLCACWLNAADPFACFGIRIARDDEVEGCPPAYRHIPSIVSRRPSCPVGRGERNQRRSLNHWDRRHVTEQDFRCLLEQLNVPCVVRRR